jgi:hypothetical protein
VGVTWRATAVEEEEAVPAGRAEWAVVAETEVPGQDLPAALAAPVERTPELVAVAVVKAVAAGAPVAVEIRAD